MAEFKRGWFVVFMLGHDMFFLVLWDGLAGFGANGDVVVVECVCDVDGVWVCFPFIDEESGGGSRLCFAWNHCFEDFCLCFWVVFGVLDLFYDVLPLGFSDGGFEFVAVYCVCFYVLWGGVVDSEFVAFVLFPDLSFDFRGAPWFSPWLWLPFMGFDDVLYAVLDVEEVL